MTDRETSASPQRTANQQFASDRSRELAGRDASAILEWATRTFSGRIAFATSLGAEDQVILDMLSRANLQVDVFTLDTGRLFPETYDVLERSTERYGVPIRIAFPDTERVEGLVREHGINLFRKSPELRRQCCKVRKVEPLRRALSGKEAWICGLRREQSDARADVQPVEWDELNGMLKVNPLVDWSAADVWKYLRERDVPYNVLHDRGFPSIGCACCTRAIEPGESERAGRFWWEATESHKECGLHLTADGRLVRRRPTQD